VGSYIDAKDAMQTWCIAKVLQIDEEKVLVNFDGWPNTYNSWLSLSSSKVAPFRQNSAMLYAHKRINLRQ